MFRLVVCHLIAIGILRFAYTLPTKQLTSPTTEPQDIFDPDLGKMTPSEDIKEFVDSVFKPVARDQDDEEDPEDPIGGNSGDNSGEKLKPKDPNNHAHVGFEQYWPGGEWVFRKAEIERCNNTVPACYNTLGKQYGKVCAADHDLQMHVTFNTLCDMYDVNCRDGTFTAFTTQSLDKEVKWFPIKSRGTVYLKISANGDNVGFILAKTKSTAARPRFSFGYGVRCGGKSVCIQFNELRELKVKEYSKSYESYLKEYESSSGKLNNKVVRHWRLDWTEKGEFNITIMREGKELWKPWHYRNLSMAFNPTYFGIWGGTEAEPCWWEFVGPGLLLAYRGACRPDLPTLPTEQPITLRHNLDIEMYNFAERMDEFGYNLSRVTGGATGNYYDILPDEPNDKNIYG